MTAAATFPFLLPLLVLAFISHGAEGFVQQLVGYRIYEGDSITVPSNGVYLVTMVVDPNGGNTDMQLKINGKPNSDFTAYGIRDVVAGLTVAMVLQAGDVIGGQVWGDLARINVCRLGVARVTSKTVPNLTYRSNKDSGAAIIRWNNILEENQQWSQGYMSQGYINLFSQKSGMYWLALRPDSDYDGSVEVRVIRYDPRTKKTDNLLYAYCEGYKRDISASGAFYLSSTDSITVERDSADKPLGPANLFSLVKLTDNNRTTFQEKYDYVAYTAHTMNRKGGVPTFAYNVKTNEGSIFDKQNNRWIIPQEGLYIVSIRGDPNRNVFNEDGRVVQSKKLLLKKLNNLHFDTIFEVFSERNVPSGQAGVFSFRLGDILIIELQDLSNYSVDIEDGTMMSIAFIARG
ncbi:uncharacterized protein [Littorina saxatilis]|uniref:Uncharacterized protein n=1 Tax=Littorina saxatilis TaxID=31220 RepID=A0AAN9GG88_9CAEN